MDSIALARAKSAALLEERKQLRISQLQGNNNNNSLTPKQTQNTTTTISSSSKKSGKKRTYTDITEEEPIQRGRRLSNASSKDTPSRSNTPTNKDSNKRKKSSSQKKSRTTVDNHDSDSEHNTNINSNIWNLSSTTFPTTSSTTTLTSKTPRTLRSMGRTTTASRRKGKTTYVIDGPSGITEIESTTTTRTNNKLTNDIKPQPTTKPTTTNTTTTTQNNRFGRLLQQYGIQNSRPIMKPTNTVNVPKPTKVEQHDDHPQELRPELRIPRTKPSPQTTATTDSLVSSSSSSTQKSFFSGLFNNYQYNNSTNSNTNITKSTQPSPANPSDREIIGVDEDVILQPRKAPRTGTKSARKPTTTISPLPSYNEPHTDLTPIPKVHDNNFSMSSIGIGGGSSSLLSGNALFNRANQLYQNFSSPFRGRTTIPTVIEPIVNSGKKKSFTSATVPSAVEHIGGQYQAPVEPLPLHEDRNTGLRRRGRSSGPSTNNTSTNEIVSHNTSSKAPLPNETTNSSSSSNVRNNVRLALMVIAVTMAIIGLYFAFISLLQIYRKHVLDTNISSKLRTQRGDIDCQTPYGETTDIHQARIPILTLRKDYCNNLVTDDMCNDALQNIINNKDYFNLTNSLGTVVEEYNPKSVYIAHTNDRDNTTTYTTIITNDSEETLHNMNIHYSYEQYMFLHANEQAAIWTWNCKVSKLYDNITYPIAAFWKQIMKWITNTINDIIEWLMNNLLISSFIGIIIIYSLLWLRSLVITQRNESMVSALWTEAKQIIEQHSNGISSDILPDLTISSLYGDKHTYYGKQALSLWNIVKKRLIDDKRISVTTIQDPITGIMHDGFIIRSTTGYFSPSTTGGTAGLYRSPSFYFDGHDNKNRSRAYSGTM